MSSKKSVFANSEEKRDFFIALIVIVVFSVFVFFLIFKSSKKETTDIPEQLNLPQSEAPVGLAEKAKKKIVDKNFKKYYFTKIKTEDTYQVKIDSAVVISDIPKSKSEVVTAFSKAVVKDSITESTNIKDKIIPPSKKEAAVIQEQEIFTENSDSIVAVEESIRETELSSKDVDHAIIEEDSKEELSKETTDVIISKQSAVEEKVEDASKAIKEKTVAETKKNVSEATTEEIFDCVIVVGAFKEEGNKKAVLEKLTTLGYASSEGVLRQGLNYVGVPVNCANKQEKRRLLKELNEAFGIDSWGKKK